MSQLLNVSEMPPNGDAFPEKYLPGVVESVLVCLGYCNNIP